MPQERLFPELYTNPELDQNVTNGDVLAILIVNKSGQVLLVKENHHGAKPWSVVTETVCKESGDRTVSDALIRAISEEVSPVIRDFRYVPGSYFQKNNIHYSAVVFDPDLYYPFFSSDPSEISGYAWVSREGLEALAQNNDLEPEVIPFVDMMYTF